MFNLCFYPFNNLELPKNPALSVQVPRRTVSENWLWEVHHVPKRYFKVFICIFFEKILTNIQT